MENPLFYSVRKFFRDLRYVVFPYVHIKSIQKALDRAREDERVKLTAYFNDLRESDAQKSYLDAEIIKGEKDSEINTLLGSIEGYKRRIKDAEWVYEECWRIIRNTLNKGIELRVKSKKLFKESAFAFTEIDDIVVRIEESYTELVKKDREMMKKLGYVRNGNSG